jgi:putative two-component system response regulator
MQGAHLDELVLQRTETIAAIQLDLVWRLGNAAEFRSNETNHHVVRVGHYSKIIAEKLGMEKDFIDLIFLASPLHDLGKITIPESIVLKNGPLTYEEWKIMKTHSRNGQEMLNTKTFAQAPTGRVLNEILHKEGNTFLDMAADIAGAHHEQWNGSGYPHGKRQEEIPLSARIVIISDVYDALRSNRTFRLEIGPGETLELMRLENNCRFDPDIFAIFEQSLADFQDIHHQHRDVGNKRMAEVTSFHRIT